MNTPEDIEAWIAERKKRFPTANRVADKKTKLEEAIARGQLPFDDNQRFPKRPRLERPDYGASRGRGSGRGSGRGRRRWDGPPAPRDRVVTSATSIQTAPDSLSLKPASPAQPPPVLPEDHDSSDSDDAPPEALPTKTTKNTVPESSHPAETSRESEDVEIKPFPREKPTGSKRPTARQPRGPPPVPFGQNTSLLRNVRPSAGRVRDDYDLPIH